MELVKRYEAFAPKKTVYTAFYCLYLLIFAVTAAFHEPWLDEAQGWMIARDASYHDMLFLLPHYEGHPPLWWLILSVPAKLGVPYELSLGAVTFVIYALTAYIIMFRSKLPPFIRLIVPFCYYTFYEYGVVARPYGMYFLGFMLMALFYNERNEKPFRFVLSCILTCASTAYGLVFCGGLSALWCVKIIIEYKKDILKFIGTRRFWALALLLGVALLEMALVFPYADTFTVDNEPMTAARFVNSFVYLFFMLPADALLIGAGGGLGTLLKYNPFPLDQVFMLGGLSLLIWVPLISICKKGKKLPELFTAYPFFALFCTFVYFMPHHEGTVVAFFVFLLWISSEKEENVPVSDGTDIKSMLPAVSGAVLSLVFVLNAMWSLLAVATDIPKDYYYGKAAAKYLKDEGLSELNVMSAWYDEADEWSGRIVSTKKQHYAVTIVPYFDRNIFFNFNSGKEGYILHIMNDDVNNADFAEWKNTVPDVLVGEPQIKEIYGNVSNGDYILIKTIPYDKVSKLSHATNFLSIYLRKDLFDDFPDIHPQNEMDMEFLEQKGN